MQICAFMIIGIGLLCTKPAIDGHTIDTSCKAFEPMRWTGQDTDDTIRQAKEHNAAWKQLCERDERR